MKSAAAGLDPVSSMGKALSNLRAVHIKGGGHFLHEEKPEEVFRELLAFLAQPSG